MSMSLERQEHGEEWTLGRRLMGEAPWRLGLSKGAHRAGQLPNSAHNQYGALAPVHDAGYSLRDFTQKVRLVKDTLLPHFHVSFLGDTTLSSKLWGGSSQHLLLIYARQLSAISLPV